MICTKCSKLPFFSTCFLLFLIFDLSTTDFGDSAEDHHDDSEDFVPRFFGGRRNDDVGSGIAPPPRTPGKLRTLSPNVKSKTFTQKLDHLNKNVNVTWQQRYFVNDAYFIPRPNGTIFITIGGESSLSPDYVQYGPMIRLAKKYNALIFALEHRFYGQSRPTKDTSVKNLNYLSSRQALADLNAFVEAQKKRYRCKNPNPKVVMYGCSYSGTLAMYYQSLYPGSAIGSISACSPLKAIENFNGYFDGITSNLAMQKTDCDRDFENAVLGLRWLLDKKDDETLHTLIEFCQPDKLNYSNPHTWDSMFYDMISSLMMAAQYNRAHLGENSELASLCRTLSKPICAKVCQKAKSEDTKEYYKICCQLFKYAMWYYEHDGSCITHDGSTIVSKSVKWESKLVERGARQWLWQMCKEFGFFTTVELKMMIDFRRPKIDLKIVGSGFHFWHLATLVRFSNSDMHAKVDLVFKNPVFRYLQKTCANSFGITNITESVDRTNTFYEQHMTQESVKRTLFVRSLSDPWSESQMDLISGYLFKRLGIKKFDFVVMNSASHCYEPIYDGTDPKDVLEAWNKIDKRIETWISGVTKTKQGNLTFSQELFYNSNEF